MHFVIVSYAFPPSREIGGRRWAKFSQQLSRKGHRVTVICSNKSSNISWYKTDYPGITFKLLPKHYPDWLTGYTKSLPEKLLYHIFIRLFSPLTRRNLFDKGFAWRRPMLEALEDIHKQVKIEVLVVTGAPYSLLYYGAMFKIKHKEILYVGDLRDPWTWGGYYGIPAMNARKKCYQEEQERVTMEVCDVMCVSTKNTGDVLKNKYPNYSNKLYLLPHAYDPDKFINLKINENRNGFVYGGSLYPGIEGYLKQLSRILKTNPQSDFSWDIYTGTHFPSLESIFIDENVKRHPLISEEGLFQRIANSAAYLVFFPATDKDLISTKFFEIIYTGTPILYIGDEGEVGKFIRENELGVHILPNNMEQELPKYLNGNIPFSIGKFDVTNYSFPIVTDNFLKMLEPFVIKIQSDPVRSSLAN